MNPRLCVLESKRFEMLMLFLLVTREIFLYMKTKWERKKGWRREENICVKTYSHTHYLMEFSETFYLVIASPLIEEESAALSGSVILPRP